MHPPCRTRSEQRARVRVFVCVCVCARAWDYNFVGAFSLLFGGGVGGYRVFAVVRCGVLIVTPNLKRRWQA